MQTFMGIGSVLAFTAAAFALHAMRSDIQLGIAATAFFSGLIMVGLAAVIGKLNRLLR